VNGTSLGSYAMVGFNISSVESPVPITELVSVVSGVFVLFCSYN